MSEASTILSDAIKVLPQLNIQTEAKDKFGQTQEATQEACGGFKYKAISPEVIIDDCEAEYHILCLESSDEEDNEAESKITS